MNNLEHVDSIDLLLLLICCLSASVRQVISHQLWPAQLVFCPELFTAQAEKLAHRTLVIIVLNPRSYLRNSDGETNLFDRDALLQCLVLYFDFDVTAPISTVRTLRPHRRNRCALREHRRATISLASFSAKLLKWVAVDQ